MQPIYIKFGV